MGRIRRVVAPLVRRYKQRRDVHRKSDCPLNVPISSPYILHIASRGIQSPTSDWSDSARVRLTAVVGRSFLHRQSKFRCVLYIRYNTNYLLNPLCPLEICAWPCRLMIPALSKRAQVSCAFPKPSPIVSPHPVLSRPIDLSNWAAPAEPAAGKPYAVFIASRVVIVVGLLVYLYSSDRE